MTEFSRPKFIEFLKPVAAIKPPSGDRWVHEIKYDGYRTQLVIENGVSRAFSKSGLDWSHKYSQIVSKALSLGCRSATIDGEVVVLDERGRSDFAKLPQAIKHRHQELIFIGFDLLHLDGKDMRQEPLLERKRLLREILQDAPEPLRYCEHIQTDGPAFFAACEDLGLEGMVSKVSDSRYRSGPNKCWLKSKCYMVTDFDLIGTALTSKGEHVALLRDQISGAYAGTAFITLKRDKREKLRERIQQLRVSQPQLSGSKFKTANWIRPGLVASVRHLRGEESLRHASLQDISFKGTNEEY